MLGAKWSFLNCAVARVSLISQFPYIWMGMLGTYILWMCGVKHTASSNCAEWIHNLPSENDTQLRRFKWTSSKLEYVRHSETLFKKMLFQVILTQWLKVSPTNQRVMKKIVNISWYQMSGSKLIQQFHIQKITLSWDCERLSKFIPLTTWFNLLYCNDYKQEIVKMSTGNYWYMRIVMVKFKFYFKLIARHWDKFFHC